MRKEVVVNHSSIRSIPQKTLSFYHLSSERQYKEVLQFRPEYSSHIEMANRTIIASADRALSLANKGKVTKALIVGVGNATEIPLSTLAQRFDEITLVDIDDMALQRALDIVDPSVRSKFILQRADITGALGMIGTGIEKAKNRTTSGNAGFSSFINEVTRSIQRVNNNIETLEIPSFGEGFDFVVSSLIFSQLPVMLRDYIYEVVNQNYGNINELRLRNPQSFQEFADAYGELGNNILTRYIEMLSNSVDATGRLYYSDTVKSFPSRRLPRSESIKIMEDKAEPMYREKFVNELLFTEFEVDEEFKPWIWNISPPANVQIPGMSMLVKAYSLKKTS